MQNPTSLLRELKGSPLSCLLALMIAGQPVNEKWIQAASGYSQNLVRTGLLHLEEVGLVDRIARYDGWSLTEQVLHLPLVEQLAGLASGTNRTSSVRAERESQNLTLPPATTATTSDVVETLDTEETAAEEERESQNLTLPPATTATTSDVVETLDTEETAAEEERESQKMTLAALHSAGIMGQKARELSKLAHVTPAFVQEHARLAREQGKPSGILVCRIRDGDPIPEECTPEERERLKEIASRRKYIEGPLGAFIEY